MQIFDSLVLLQGGIVGVPTVRQKVLHYFFVGIFLKDEKNLTNKIQFVLQGLEGLWNGF